MDEYLCLNVLSQPGEAESAFKARLSAFWTRMLREFESDFEKVYAETVAFESIQNRLARKYLVESDAISQLTTLLQQEKLDFEPIDEDDTYSKYEAQPPEWFWIEH